MCLGLASGTVSYLSAFFKSQLKTPFPYLLLIAFPTVSSLFRVNRCMRCNGAGRGGCVRGCAWGSKECA